MDEKQRLCLVSFSELLDRLSIAQIKELLVSEHRASFSEEIRRLIQDINLIIKENDLRPTARFIRLIVVLAQINLHIWHTKDVMMENEDRFDECMKLAHQLNGIRNRVKNALLEETGFARPTKKKTNIDTDNLVGWKFSL